MAFRNQRPRILRREAELPTSWPLPAFLLCITILFKILHFSPPCFEFSSTTTYYIRPFAPKSLMYLFTPAYIHLCPRAFPTLFGATSEWTAFVRVRSPHAALIHLSLTRMTHLICSTVLTIDIVWAWFWMLSYSWKQLDPPYEPGNFLNELT